MDRTIQPRIGVFPRSAGREKKRFGAIRGPPGGRKLL